METTEAILYTVVVPYIYVLHLVLHRRSCATDAEKLHYAVETD